MGGEKLWVDVAGRPLVAWTLDAVAASDVADVLVVAAPRDRWEAVRELHAGRRAELRIIEGGPRRQDTVRGLLPLCAGADVIVVHDAARPRVPPDLFHTICEAAHATGAATAALPVCDSIKQVHAGRVAATLPRAYLMAVQTPQGFRADVLVAAHSRAVVEGWEEDDDCALVERCGQAVCVVPGDLANIKVTTPHDLRVLRLLAAAGFAG